jgi:hypothetical protein
MSIRKTLVSIAVGFIFARLTSWSFQNVDVSNQAAPLRLLLELFLTPGLVISVAVAGNVHTYEAGPAAMGNFIFYFAVTYVCAVVWHKRRPRSPNT